GAQLPFPDQSFDAVVASDVMEHVPPEGREVVIGEVLRVSRKLAVIGYPSGNRAFDADKRLREDYLRRKIDPPVWLEEHMMHAFPERELFSNLLPGWTLEEFPNESLSFHNWMMRMETYRPLNYLFRFGLLIVPKMIERFLQHMDVE